MLFRSDPFKAMQDQASRNMAMFSDAMRVFNPFAAAMGTAQPAKPAAQNGTPGAAKDDLQSLKDQLAAMQKKLDNIAGG